MATKRIISDFTIIFFVCSLILAGIVIYMASSKNEPTHIQLQAKRSTSLYGNTVLTDDAVIKTVSPGENITLLGQRIPSGGKSMVFWAETGDGQRGYVRQEFIDEKIIVFDTKCVEANETVGVKAKDTVTVSNRLENTYDEYNIITRDGKKGICDSEGLLSATGMDMLDYSINEKVCYFLSKQKFEKLYLGKSFEEIEQLYRKAWFVKKKGSAMEAEYPLRIFDKKDGSFHIPTIVFENNIATSYTTTPSKKGNKFLLRILPLSDKILDVDFFSQFISRGYFSKERVADNASVPILLKVGLWIVGIFIIAGFLSWVFLSNFILPFFLFGLMRFRYPLIFVSNKAMRLLLLVVVGLCTYLWIILGLAYSFSWWYFVPILFIAAWWITPKILEWFDDFPSNRCPRCKSLYTIEYDSEVFVHEYQEWRKETKSTKIGSRSSRERVHDTEITKWSDGNTTSRDFNHRTVTHTTSTYNNDVYDVLYLIKVYKQTYKCEHCGFEEYGSRKELNELERKYKGSYIDSTTTHSGY